MCLSLPCKVIETEENEGKAVIEFNGIKAKAFNIAKAKKGDFVLVKEQNIIEVLSKEEEKETQKALNVIVGKKKKRH
ncbi:MAG: HypC/HybG/HupF family hydrogenase formation chaperone [Candidatus Diapherotrites archaeon]